MPAGRRIARLFEKGAKGNQMALIAAGCLAIVVGLIFSRSRTGLALGMLGILASTLVFARRMGAERSMRMASIVLAIVVALGAEIGLTPVLERFTNENVAADLRWSMYSGTITGIGQFFPMGSGIGTFPDVFRRFQPGDIGQFVNNAHDDYLEWAFEGGIPALALVLIFLAFYIRRWPPVWRAQRWSRLRYLQAGAGIALALMGLHTFIDFNLHIPANQIYFAFLAAAFFHRETETPRVERRKFREPETSPESGPQALMPEMVPEDVPNPFGR
jgi:O-antigen ligase